MSTAYVIIGTTGEYADRSEWPVAVYPPGPAGRYWAEKHLVSLRETATAIFNRVGNRMDACEADLRPLRRLDPKAKMDYTGTRYRMKLVPFRTLAPEVEHG